MRYRAERGRAAAAVLVWAAFAGGAAAVPPAAPRFADAIGHRLEAPLRGTAALRLDGATGVGEDESVAIRIVAPQRGVLETVVLAPGSDRFEWDSTRVADGPYTLRAVLIDLARDRERVTDSLQVTVDNRPVPVAPEPEAAPEAPGVRFGAITYRPPVELAPAAQARYARTPPPPEASIDASQLRGVHHERLLRAALGYRGTPYRFGASGRSAFDCSSFTQTIYRDFGVSLPRTAAAQFEGGSAVSKTELKPGDLVFFKNTYKAGISHVGIFLGDGKFIHAAGTGLGVRVDSLGGAYFTEHWAGARRYR